MQCHASICLAGENLPTITNLLFYTPVSRSLPLMNSEEKNELKKSHMPVT